MFAAIYSTIGFRHISDHNICYMVFLNLVQWYSISKLIEMRQSPEVKQFWHIGKVLFHSKFLDFMRRGQVIFDEERGRMSRDSSRNFPVPIDPKDTSSKILDKLCPGFFKEFLEVYLKGD